MKNRRMLAMLLSVLMLILPLGNIAAAEGGEGANPTDVPATATPAPTDVPATATPAPTDVPATATPAPTDVPATATPAPTDVPATATPAPTDVPATATPVPTDAPATNAPSVLSDLPTDAPAPTDVPATATPVPTARPYFPRAVFDPASMIVELGSCTQGGYVLVALPIGYAVADGQTVWSNAVNQSGWTPGSADDPAYFRQDLTNYLTEAKWRVRGEGFELDAVFEDADTSENIFAYAPEENDWNMAEDTPFNMGYAVFRMPIRMDAPGGSYTLRFEFQTPDQAMNEEKIEVYVSFSLNAPVITPSPTPTEAPTATPEPTVTIAPTATTEPTATADPTATTEPTATVDPSATTEPTATVDPSATTEPTATVDPNATTEPTATADPSATTEPTATAAPTATPEPTATTEPAATADPSATPEPTATAAPTATPEPVAMYVSLSDPGSTLNLRSAASTDGAVVAQLPHGTHVLLLNSSDGWGLIEVDGKQGYVNVNYLSAVNPVPTATPTPAPTSTPEPTTAPTAENTVSPTDAPQENQASIVFKPEDVIGDLSNVKPGGRLLVALPIGYDRGDGSVFYSNAGGSAIGSWTAGAAANPNYFSQEIAGYLNEAKWWMTARDNQESELQNAIFDLSGGDSRNIMYYAHANNEWGLAAGAPVNMGYAVFDLPINSDAPNGSYSLTFEFDMPANVANWEQHLSYVLSFTVTGEAAVEPTGTPDPTDEPEATDEPEETEEPWDEPTDDPDDPWGDEESETSRGVIMVGQSEVQTVKVRQTGVTLAVPVSYVVDNLRIYSNHSEEGIVVEPGQGVEAYSQEILDYVDWLEISISPETAASDAFPFQLSEQGVGKTVISGGENFGYAVFENLTVKKNLSNGTTAVPLVVRWMEMGGETIYETDISALINVTGASSGGGGSSYVAPTTPPQARVLVESLYTNPSEVKAGDQFDLIMMLRNTSASQYVQNMKVTITSEEDILIPLTGSNTLYIDRIDADSVYELRYPVRANMEVPDRPLRVEVTIEYEDSKVSAQSAAQTLVLNVEQNRRVKIDEPVLDNAAPMVGDSVTASLQVINEGRTILYNMTVTAQCESENIILPVSSYLGNMEGGTSKKAELDLMPLAAEDYNVTLQISYEDAMGVQYTESKAVSFMAQEESVYDDYYYYQDNSYNEGYEDYEEPGLTAETVMQMLPGWFYAMGGTLLGLIILLMGVSARSRRRKALEDDEMD